MFCFAEVSEQQWATPARLCAVGVKGQAKAALPLWRAPTAAKASMTCLAPLTKVLAGRILQRMLHKHPLKLGVNQTEWDLGGSEEGLGAGEGRREASCRVQPGRDLTGIKGFAFCL